MRFFKTFLLLSCFSSICTAANPREYDSFFGQKKKRILFICVGAEWCPSCKIQKSNIKKCVSKLEEKEGPEVVEKCVFVNVDKQEHPDLAEKLISGTKEPQSLPKILIYYRNPELEEGWERKDLSGLQSSERLETIVKDVVEKEKEVNGEIN